MNSETTAGRRPRTGTEASPAQKSRGGPPERDRCACGREHAGYDAERDLPVCTNCADGLALDVQKGHESGVGVVYAVSRPGDPHARATVAVLPDGVARGLQSERCEHGDYFVDAARRAVVEQGCATAAPDL